MTTHEVRCATCGGPIAFDDIQPFCAGCELPGDHCTCNRRVWVLVAGYEPDEVYGVFASQEKAQAECDRLNSAEGHWLTRQRHWLMESELYE